MMPESPTWPMKIFPRLIKQTEAVVPAVDGRPVDEKINGEHQQLRRPVNKKLPFFKNVNKQLTFFRNAYM